MEAYAFCLHLQSVRFMPALCLYYKYKQGASINLSLYYMQGINNIATSSNVQYGKMWYD